MKTIKKISALMTAAILTAALILSCQKPTETGEEETGESPEVVAFNKDSLELAFVRTLDEIDRSIENIIEKQQGIALHPAGAPEENIPVNEKILRKIQMINSLMAENKDKMDKLARQIKDSKIENAKLKDLMARTEERLRQNEDQLAKLKEDLSGKDFKLAELNKSMDDLQLKSQMLQDMVDKYDRDIHTAYFVVGTYKELRNQGVLAKEGGVLGVGGVTTLKKGFAEDVFTKIDTKQTGSIPINSNTKKVKVVTSHSPDSYELKKEGNLITALEIKNPDEFWKASKFLVMETR